MKKIIWVGFSIIVTLSIVIGITLVSTSKERISEQFAEQLFNYPLPPETALISKHQFNGKNFVDGGGSGGYWNVVAVMELTSKLSRNEIISYYQHVQPFSYPKSKTRGVELELYFEEDTKKIEHHNRFYFRSQDGQARPISQYSSESEPYNQDHNETSYVIQMISGFDYLLNID